MEKGKIIKFDPKLLGAIREAMGELPTIPRDLTKIKALTIFDKHNFAGEAGWIFLNWMEYAPGHFSAIGAMENLHTLLFKNHGILCVEDFTFLSQLKRLKKLDLSGTNFSDCALLKDLPALQYAILPDRRQLIHTKVLKELPARVETKTEKEERERCRIFCNNDKNKGREWSASPVPYTADRRLIQWIITSLGGMPKTPAEMMKITQLDNLGVEISTNKKLLWADGVAFGVGGSESNSLCLEKEGDFSLLAKLPNLRALFLWGTDLEDFSFLSECRQLSFINLWNTKFVDCKILENLPALRYVGLPEEGQLKNLAVLTKRRAAEEMQKEEEAWEYMLAEDGKKTPPKNPLIIKTEPKIPEIKPEEIWETFEEKELGKDGENTENAKEEMKWWRRKRIETKKRSEKKAQDGRAKEEIPFYREDAFDYLAIVYGEQAVFPQGDGAKVRHVSAQFWMDAKLPPVWEKFCKLALYEDNWAKLPKDKAEELTDELVRLVRQGDVAVLFLALDACGEGPFLTLEFSGDWAAVNYMDDDHNVYYSCYNPDFTNGSELSPVEIGGQSPVPKMLALNDLGLAADIVREFLEHGKLLTGSLWKTNQGMEDPVEN